MGAVAEEWGEEIPPSEVVNPVIFHFRPNRYFRVGREKLAEWEQFFAENVGFPPSTQEDGAAAERTAWAGSPGGGVSGSDDGWDDCIE